MDWIDWVLAIVFLIIAALMLGLLLPPYGYLVGAVLGAYIIYAAKKNRDRLKAETKK